MKHIVAIFLVGLCACTTAPDGIPIESTSGPVKFVISKDKKGECRWNLVASNGKTIATSSEGYSSRRSCDRSIELTRQAGDATVVDRSSPTDK